MTFTRRISPVLGLSTFRRARDIETFRCTFCGLLPLIQKLPEDVSLTEVSSGSCGFSASRLMWRTFDESARFYRLSNILRGLRKNVLKFLRITKREFSLRRFQRAYRAETYLCRVLRTAPTPAYSSAAMPSIRSPRPAAYRSTPNTSARL